MPESLDDRRWRTLGQIMRGAAGIIVALLSAIGWVMWNRIDNIRDAQRGQETRISRVEGQMSAVLESIQHDSD